MIETYSTLYILKVLQGGGKLKEESVLKDDR